MTALVSSTTSTPSSRTEQGKPYTVPNVICLHEEDYGILWKHSDPRSGRTEVRRSRRLVISSIATVGNYEYGFFWYFYLDGSIHFEVKMTGILSTMAVAPGEKPPYANMIAPQLAAPFHQHLFNMRMDMEIDGPHNSVYEMEALPVPPGPDNPWSNAFESVATLLRTEQDAQRVVDPGRSRYWKVVNNGSINRLGEPVAYKLGPGPRPRSWPPRIRAWADGRVHHPEPLGHALRPAEERRAGGDYPNQHRGATASPGGRRRP